MESMRSLTPLVLNFTPSMILLCPLPTYFCSPHPKGLSSLHPLKAISVNTTCYHHLLGLGGLKAGTVWFCCVSSILGG